MIRLFYVLLTACLVFSCEQPEKAAPVYKKVTGITMGVVTYNVTYRDTSNTDLYPLIDSLLDKLNTSLSTYIPESEISVLNATNKLTYSSPFFEPMLRKSKEIYSITSGAFDPTVGPLVNLWGFGPEKDNDIPDSLTIAETMKTIGFDKVVYDEEQVTTQQGVMLDFSAIAKGYAVDEVANLLQQKGITDYFVEIGGEVTCKGVNPKGQAWRTGIFDPRVTNDPSRQLAAIVSLEDMAVATSGNYRNFYVKDGKKYAHTISPFTGYPVEHSLLSASVFANTCVVADAYATAFLVIGLEKAIQLTEANPALEAHLIYVDTDGNLASYSSGGIKDKIILE
ncbi:MAG: FAD:protein FMN transferase [Cyclobacteriaceae bacterium]